MVHGIRKIPSGFNFIDKNWGGIYRGGSYMLIGPRKSGRTLLGLQMAMESAKSSDVCLYFTLMRPKDLMIQAASLNFDIQTYMNQNLIIVVRVAQPIEAYEMYNPDDYLVEYFNDIITVVDDYRPSRIIFDEITPFVGFKNLDYLEHTFLRTIENIEDRDITSLFIIGEPATQKTHEIVEGLSQYVTGKIILKKESNNGRDRYQGGFVTISPNVGHTEGEFTSEYRIEPNKGVTTEFTLDRPTITIEEPPMIPKIRNFSKPTKVDIPNEPYAFSNIYNYNDFLLILNNQIALYKSTGQQFNLVSIKLEPTAQMRGLLTINQLQNAVRQSTSKKDKICVVDNKIIVLLLRGNLKSIIDLMTNVANNLPSKDPSYVSAILDFISIYNLEVDERFENAEMMMETVLSSELATSAYQPLNKYIG
ncbi:MAG: ATPase domain-containing protein [Stygiobacter sp.]|jgi:circadian clock protein KaiC|uniref:ATPase domain-containing protein n=1 Tax=Stygiobacter electus TaxID=3032292 RepID=A0AAE3TBE0_9BACT|nr:ATPase domain-containing protein [Stygiobacter electus]MDF1610710.1 ATPase domain-containing protein [Stygiobacter electus]